MSVVDKYTRLDFCHKVLPLAYDDSISYYEQICKLMHKMNELVDMVNNISVELLDEAKQYTDSQLASMRKDISDAISEIEQLKVELNEQYREFERVTNAQLVLFNNKLNTFDNKIDNAIIGVNARTDLAIEQNNEYIFEEIGKQALGNIKVINYFTGERISIQDMFDYLARLHTNESYTYDEFANLNLLVQNVIDYHMTFTDFILHGKEIIE